MTASEPHAATPWGSGAKPASASQPTDEPGAPGAGHDATGLEHAPPEVTLPGWRLLDMIVMFILRFVSLPRKEAADAIALWVAHTWVFEVFEITPRLSIESAEMRSGKSRLLEVLALLVARPFMAVTPSEAVVFRSIEAHHPTLILDEVDAIFGPKARDNEGLRAILNAGWARGATVPRMVGQGTGMQVKPFSVYGPVVLAGIGSPPTTVCDRSIRIVMKRRGPGERVEKFRRRTASAEGDALRQQLAQWTAEIRENLVAATPDVPEELNDRAADFWEPPLAIADAAGGDWPERARRAAVLLSADPAETAVSEGVELLGDIRRVFDTAGVDRMFSKDLARRLNDLEDAGWSEAQRGQPLTPAGLSRLLKPYGIRSAAIRIASEGGRKGYFRDDFNDAWGRYLAPTDTPDQPASTPEDRLDEPHPSVSDVDADIPF